MGCKIIADDFGMSIEINHAISELIQKNLLAKVSIMANDSINYSSNDLENVKTGLHINLMSYKKGIGLDRSKIMSFLEFLYSVYAGQLKDTQITDSINHQFEFLENRDIKITYLDTHQHVHIVPKLLRLLIMFAKTKGIHSIRCITMERRHMLFYLYSLIRFGFAVQTPKMILLYSLGILMKSKLKKSQINYCKNLILMPLAQGGNYSALLKALFNRFKNEDAEIVTHPGLEKEACLTDNYSSGRYVEYCSLLNLMPDLEDGFGHP